MAFSLAGISSLDEINADVFRSSAREVGLGERMAMRRFDLMCAKFRDALETSAEELASVGYHKAHAIKELILQTGGIQNILL